MRLEAEHRLSIDDTLGNWLPQYPQWRDVTIRRLLNMTSGIPAFEEQPAFQRAYLADPHQYFSPDRLVSYAVGAPPPAEPFYYSNTNYVLAEMIVAKASHDTYRHQLYSRLLQPLGLDGLYYGPHSAPRGVLEREPAAYFATDAYPILADLIGQDVSRQTLSWARGAGAMLGTTHDMTVWERALYGGTLLPPRQQAELTSLVSQTSGEPIERPSPLDQAAFGLGLDVRYLPPLDTMLWNYEGGTMGMRVMHVYLPTSGVIVAFGLNSERVGRSDHIDDLLLALWNTLLAHGLVTSTAAAAR